LSQIKQCPWRNWANEILGENLRYLREDCGLDRSIVTTEPPIDPGADLLVEEDKIAFMSRDLSMLPGLARDLGEAAAHIEHYRTQSASIRNAQLILSIGIHWGLAPFLAQHLDRETDAVVVFLELEPRQAQVAFRLYDLREVLESPNFFWCVGEGFADHLIEIFRSESLYLIDQRRIAALVAPGLSREVEGTYQRAVSEVFRAVSTDRQRIAESLAKPADSTRDRPRRIWIPLYEGSLHEPIVRAVAEGFRVNGNEVEVAATTSGRTMPLRFISGIADTRPDLVFLLNLPGRNFLKGLGVPLDKPLLDSLRCVTWYVDNPVFYSDAKPDSFSDEDHVYWMDRSWESHLPPIAPTRGGLLPVAGSVPREGEDIERFRHPVSFVGSILETRPVVRSLSKPDRDAVMTQVERLLAGDVESLFDSARQIELTATGVETVGQFVATIRKQPLGGLAAIAYFLYTVANAEKRIRFLGPLVPLGLHVYGTTLWGELLPGIPRDHVHGAVSGEDVIDVYRSSLINIGLHSYQCPTALSPRDFDVLLSGGCLVADWVGDCGRGLIEPGVHAIFVRDSRSLVETVSELLHDESKRRGMAKAGRRHVAEHHTYAERTREILRRLES